MFPKISLIVALLSSACVIKSIDVDKHSEVDANIQPEIELVCPQDFCGTITDKSSGITTDCGSCSGYSQCGDNAEPNICGNACMPVVINAEPSLDACNFAFGENWARGYGTPVEYPFACNYVNPTNCRAALNAVSDSGTCNGSICMNVWCCVDNTSTGATSLLQGAVASSDGGLF